MELAPLLRSTAHIKPSTSVQASSLHSRASTPAPRFNGKPAAAKGWFQKLIAKLKDWWNRFINIFKKDKPSNGDTPAVNSTVTTQTSNKEASSNSIRTSSSTSSIAMHPKVAERREKLASQRENLKALPEQFETWLKGLETHYKCLSPEGEKLYPNWNENHDRTSFTKMKVEETLSTLILDCHNFAGSLQVFHPDATAQIKKYKTLASETKKIRDQFYEFNKTCPIAGWTKEKQAEYSERTQALKEAFKAFLAKAGAALPESNT